MRNNNSHNFLNISLILLIMADEIAERKSSRNKRTNIKKYREDIYFYDIP
jgi:hypothetical protein